MTAEKPPRPRMIRPGWYWWAAMLASSLAVGIGSVLISLHAQAESERKWCSVVITLDDAWRETPPTTKAGRNMASNIAQLRRELDCPT